MEYYLWKNNLRDSKTEAMLSDVPEAVSKDGVRFDAGLPIAVDLDLPLRVALGSESLGRTLTDSIMSYGRWALLASDRLKDKLDSVGIDNIQWYPLVIHDEILGADVEGFWVGNVVGLVDCVDWDEAEIDEFDAFFEKLWIDANKVSGLSIFRQADFEHHLLVSERVKDAVEAAGCSGVKFVPANGYADG